MKHWRTISHFYIFRGVVTRYLTVRYLYCKTRQRCGGSTGDLCYLRLGHREHYWAPEDRRSCETEVKQNPTNTLFLLRSSQGDGDKPGILRSWSDQDNCEDVRLPGLAASTWGGDCYHGENLCLQHRPERGSSLTRDSGDRGPSLHNGPGRPSEMERKHDGGASSRQSKMSDHRLREECTDCSCSGRCIWPGQAREPKDHETDWSSYNTGRTPATLGAGRG